MAAKPKFAFTFTGIDDLLKDIPYLTKNIVENMDLYLAGSAEATAVAAQAAVPVDTGALRRSITHVRNGLMNYTVIAAEPYAPYVEFGTGSLVDVPTGLEQYAIQFKGHGSVKVNLPARPYLFPAYEQERKKLIEQLKKDLLAASMSGITVIMPNGSGNITSITTI